MNILHIAGGDLSGGAARGTYWLHQALIEKGVNSKLIIQNYEGFEKNISGIRRNFKEKLFNRIRPLLDQSLLKFYPNKKERSFSPGCFGYDIRKHPFYEKSDIIHLHWINNAMIDVKILSKIDKPVIWTIRDMWPFTGGCHCALDCEKYATGCGACPLLNSIDENDLSKKCYDYKKKYINDRVVPVAMSEWIAGCIKRSSIFNNNKIEIIQNCIDKDFLTIDKAIARKALSINTNKPIILIGACSITDINKGFDYCKQLLKNKCFKYVFFGNIKEDILKSLNIDYLSFGYINNILLLRLIYSVADVFVTPSLQESFGKTVAEAMACGTPVVAFDNSGPKDIIDHKENGYLAKAFSEDDIVSGVEWILNKDSDELGKAASDKIQNNFTQEIIADRHIELYKKLI